MSPANPTAEAVEQTLDAEGCEPGARLAIELASSGLELPEVPRQRLRECLQDAPPPIQSVVARACILTATPSELAAVADDLVHDQRDLVRDAASDALVDRGVVAVPALRQLLQSEDRDVRWYATEALAREQDEAFLPLLVDRLGDDDFSIRWVASNGLLAVGSASIVPILRALIQREPSLLFHNAARRVLARVSASPSIEEPIAELVDSLGRSTTVYQSQALATALLERLLGQRSGT